MPATATSRPRPRGRVDRVSDAVARAVPSATCEGRRALALPSLCRVGGLERTGARRCWRGYTPFSANMERLDYIERELYPRIRRHLDRQKSILLLGPRQTGKTTLLD